MENDNNKIKFFKRSQIDSAKWNFLVKNSPERLIYFELWYLDSMTCGNWNALIYGDYEFIMPLPFRKKYFIPYIYQPFVTQRLGIIGIDLCSTEILTRFLRYVPLKYLIVHFSVGLQLKTINNYMVARRDNHILRLKNGYHSIIANYNRNTNRNIQSANGYGLRIDFDLDIEQFLEFQCKWEPYEFTKPNVGYIKNLVFNAEKLAQSLIVGVYDSNVLISAGLFIVDTQRVYFLLCSSSDIGKEKRAMFFLIDRVVDRYAGEDKIFDFTGSSIKSISHRNLGFGAETEHYSFLNRKSVLRRFIR